MDNFTVSNDRDTFSAWNYVPYAAAVQLGGTNYRLTASGRQLNHVKYPQNPSIPKGSYLSVSSNYAQGAIAHSTGRKQGLGELAKDLESLLAKAKKNNQVIPVIFNIAGPRLNSEEDAKLVPEQHREIASQLAREQPGNFVYAVNAKPGSSESGLPIEFFDLMNFIDKLANKEQMQYEFVNDCVCNLRGVAEKHKLDQGSNLVHLINGTGLNIALGNNLQVNGKFADEINTESGHLKPEGLLPQLPFYKNYTKFLESQNNPLTLEGLYAGGNEQVSPYRGLRGMILYLRSLSAIQNPSAINPDTNMRLALDALNFKFETKLTVDDIIHSELYSIEEINLNNERIIEKAKAGDSFANRLVELYSRNLAHALAATQGDALKQAKYFSYSGGWMQSLFKNIPSAATIFQEEFNKLGINATIIDFRAEASMDGLVEMNQVQSRKGHGEFMHAWQNKFGSFNS
jgi:hypothetical protein